MNILRKYIRHLILEHYHLHENDNVKKNDDLLVEPDVSEDREKDEQNVVANIAGVTAPLGLGPTFPSSKTKKKKMPSKRRQKSKK